MPTCKTCGSFYSSRYGKSVCKSCRQDAKELKRSNKVAKFLGKELSSLGVGINPVYIRTQKHIDLCGPERCMDIWDNVESLLSQAAREVRMLRAQAMKRATAHRRRAAILQAGGCFSRENVVSLFEKQRKSCQACGCDISDGYHIDHIYPLARGGANDNGNIQLLCQPCNNRKHVKDPIQFLIENGYRTYCEVSF